MTGLFRPFDPVPGGKRRRGLARVPIRALIPNMITLLALAVVVGTAAGLVVKYILDKRWIFADRTTGVREHGRKFSLYTAMGLITTAIFWASETAFWLIWNTHEAREIGAVLGLAVGYVVKYQLDRRFVFNVPGSE